MSSKKITLRGETAQAIYEELKTGSLASEKGKLKQEITVPYENMLIKEIEYTILKDKYEMTYFKRFIFRNNKVYQVTIGAKTRHFDILKEEREIFFNSFLFTD